MPPYSWIHLENVWWVVAGGLMVALAIILARASRTATFTLDRRSDEEIEQSKHVFAGDVAEYNRPVPVFIWLVAIGYFIWAVAYVIFSGKYGL